MTLPPIGSSSSRPRPAPDPSSLSLFELPVSKGARWARIFVVLVLDIALAGTGIAMIIAYVNARADASDRTESVAVDAGLEAEVEILEPEVVPTEPEDTAGQPVGPTRLAKRGDSGAKQVEPRSNRPKPGKSSETAPAPTSAPPPDPPPEPRVAEDPPPKESTPDAPESGTGADAGTDEIDDAAAATLAAQIRTVVSRHRPQIRRCYAQAAKVTTPADPLEGRIDIRFSVMPDGSASGVRVVRNTTDSDLLGRCLAALITSWDFPSGHATPASFIWPFQFSAPKNQ